MQVPKAPTEYVESLDVTDWLCARYGQDLNENVLQVKINQTASVVWVEMTYSQDTDLGRKTRQTYLSLDALAVAYDKPLDIVPEGESRFVRKIYDAARPIEDNAREFFSHRALLQELTDLFKQEDQA
jgi:hypothetical protein